MLLELALTRKRKMKELSERVRCLERTVECLKNGHNWHYDGIVFEMEWPMIRLFCSKCSDTKMVHYWKASRLQQYYADNVGEIPEWGKTADD